MNQKETIGAIGMLGALFIVVLAVLGATYAAGNADYTGLLLGGCIVAFGMFIVSLLTYLDKKL